MTFIFFLVLDLFHRLSFAIGLVVFLSRCRPPCLRTTSRRVSSRGVPRCLCAGRNYKLRVDLCFAHPGVSVVSVDFLLIIHIKGNDKGDYLHVDVLVEMGMHPCGFPIPDRGVVPAYMFGILRAESGEVGGEVLPETAVKRRFASKQARCRRRKFGIEADVDRQRLDRLLDSRDSALISCFFLCT